MSNYSARIAQENHLSQEFVIEERVIQRAMADYPAIDELIPGSTPVVSFGNPVTADVVTIGINPSSKEFLVNGAGTPLLARSKKRLVDAEVLGLSKISALNREQAIAVIKGCYEYFNQETANPYMTWFKHLNDNVNKHLGVSYLDGTAAHLDLVQWATDPVWGGVASNDIKKRLLDADAEFLNYQINSGNYRAVFMNGREVINQLKSLGIAHIEEVNEISYKTKSGKLRPIEFLKGVTPNGTLLLGWSKTFPGHYISKDALLAVVAQLHEFMDRYVSKKVGDK